MIAKCISGIKRYCYFLIGIFLFGCNESSDPTLFVQLAPGESGIEFQNILTESDTLNIIQYLYFYNGGGVATGDVNNDGLVDIFFASNMGNSQLYLNRSVNGKIKFEKSPLSVGISDLSGWSTGVNLVDINGDGLLDIYICQVNYKSIRGTNRLFINLGVQNGLPQFKEMAREYGLHFQGLSTQSAFFDYDLDGDLDMYLLNHSVHSPENYAKAEVRNVRDEGGDRFYKQEDGVFIDITEEVGIYNSRIGFGLGMAISDLNKDGYPDIYIGNDFHENDYLYINQGDGSFNEVIKHSVGHTSQFSMGVDIADINNDGWSDILSLDMMPSEEIVKRSSVPPDNYEIYKFKHDFGYHYQLPRNALQLYRGQSDNGIPKYSEIGQLLGVEDTDWSWSGLLGDYNNDGLKDLFITNGIVRRPNDLDYLNYISDPLTQSKATDIELATQMPDGKVANFLFLNKGNLEFLESSDSIKDNMPGISNGAAYADFDNDGDLDIIVNNINEPASLLINETNGTDYIRLVLNAKGFNTQGLGAKIWLHGGQKFTYYEHFRIKGMMSSSGGPIILGTSSFSSLDSLIIEWPGGKREVIAQLQNGQTIEANGVHAYDPIDNNYIQAIEAPYFTERIDLVNYIHFENEFIDANRQKLIPWLLSTQGPALAVGDVNGDRLEDIYFGGAKDQPGVLLVQLENSEFIQSAEEVFELEKYFEDVDAEFVDIDNDGDLDLYVVSGGNEALKDAPLLWDRIYVNDGKGGFERMKKDMPLITENGSTITSGDIDNDGDQDLAIASIVATGNYGISKGGNILANDGTGKFRDVTNSISRDLKELGMISDMKFSDIDNDGDEDLIVAGEWMPITILTNSNGLFNKIEIPGSSGLWRTIEIADLNNDGLDDLIAGNFGQNTFLAQGTTIGLALGDYDDNLISEPLIYYENNGAFHPIAGRDLLISQMNYFKNLHKDYTSFAHDDFNEMFEPVIHKKLKDHTVNELASCWFKNLGNGQFEKIPFPKEAQMAPVFSIAVLKNDVVSAPDLFLGGNFHELSPIIGRADASYGVYLKQDAHGVYQAFSPKKSGLFIDGQIRKMRSMSIGGEEHLVIAINNDAARIFRRN